MKRVIKESNLPLRSPLISNIVAGLLLDRLKAPGWVWGSVGVLFVFVWIGFFVCLFTYEHVDVLKGDGQ